MVMIMILIMLMTNNDTDQALEESTLALLSSLKSAELVPLARLHEKHDIIIYQYH